MKNDCSIVKDLLPLYIEDMVSLETANFINNHLQKCQECRAELEKIKTGATVLLTREEHSDEAGGAVPFRKIMKRFHRQFYSLGYSLIIFLIFLGFGLLHDDYLMYNCLIMPVVGVVGYCVLGWRSVYKVPALLLTVGIIFMVFKLFGELGIVPMLTWVFILFLFTLVGVAIAALLHFALKKEDEK